MHTYHEAAFNSWVCGDQGFCVQWRYLIAIGQDNNVIISSFIGPKIRLGRMFDIQIFEIDSCLVRKCVENALEEGCVLVAMNPMLISTGLHLFKFKTGERMKGEVEPIFPAYPEITDEQALCCACQVQNSDNFVHFASTNWTDGTFI